MLYKHVLILHVPEIGFFFTVEWTLYPYSAKYFVHIFYQTWKAMYSSRVKWSLYVDSFTRLSPFAALWYTLAHLVVNKSIGSDDKWHCVPAGIMAGMLYQLPDQILQKEGRPACYIKDWNCRVDYQKWCLDLVFFFNYSFFFVYFRCYWNYNK